MIGNPFTENIDKPHSIHLILYIIYPLIIVTIMNTANATSGPYIFPSITINKNDIVATKTEINKADQ
jgi:hypothetical protein